jgi:hypothetical protein
VPSNIIKYDDKTNPTIWLEDYHLACKEGWAEDNMFIIQFLLIYLADSARAWLDHLSRNVIDGWEDLMEIFTSNPWDLKSCQQKFGESLRDYIRCFSQKCHELPRVADADTISAFWSSTTCRTLVHGLSDDQPNTTKEVLNIATRHASGEEVVGAVFILGDGQMVPSGSRVTPSKAIGKGTKKGIKGG